MIGDEDRLPALIVAAVLGHLGRGEFLERHCGSNRRGHIVVHGDGDVDETVGGLRSEGLGALTQDATLSVRRSVADALVFYSSAPKDVVSDAKLSTTLENEKSVFPGLHRTLEGEGLGKNLAPLAVDGEYTAEGAATVEKIDQGTAIVEGVEPGEATITYETGVHMDSVKMRVLGDLLAIRPSARTLSLPDPDSTRNITLTGIDSDGRRARIETQDVKVEASKGFTVTDDGLGTWTIAGTGDAEAGTVTFSVGDVETTIPVSYGTKEEQVFDFSDLGAFKDGNARASGSLEPATGEDGESPAVRLQYDFTQSTATRGYYLIANEPVKVEGNALAFTATVKGDATGVWPRLQVVDGKGTRTNINGENVTFDGWSQVVFKVPEGLAQPLTVEAIRLMETRPDAQYKGDLTVSALTATTTTSAEAGGDKAIHDPALLTVGSVDDGVIVVVALSVTVAAGSCAVELSCALAAGTSVIEPATAAASDSPATRLTLEVAAIVPSRK